MAAHTVTIPAQQQAQLVAQAAKQQGLSPLTLWGVYGWESNFGQGEGPSYAGAEGPFQFLPSTGAEYGLNSSTIWDFQDSLTAAARYLKSLGANSDPSSPQTLAALNGYNGNKGGASQTTYTQHVIALGPQIEVAGVGLAKPLIGGTAGKIVQGVGSGIAAVAAPIVGLSDLLAEGAPELGAAAEGAGAGAGGAAGATAASKLLQTGGAVAAFELFKGWFPKAALWLALLGLGIGLLYVAARRGTSARTSS